MKLDLDTGSSDFWVFSTELPPRERGNHPLYKLGGYKDQGYSWHIHYGDGTSASGQVYADKVSAGSVTAPVQAVEVAQHIAPDFTHGRSDGLVGLGFDEQGNTCHPTYCFGFFTNIAPTLPQPVISAALKHDAPGHYDFGFIDQSAYTGSIAYATVDPSHGYWEFQAGGFAVGSVEHQTEFRAIADTGSSLLLVNQHILVAYWSQVEGAYYSSYYGGIVFPCSARLPDFSLFIDGEKRTMPGKYANYIKAGGDLCYGGVQITNADFNIIGDLFLKSQYVVFDRSGPRVGFAQQA